MKEKIAVIAGTPADTQMGVDYLTKKGMECVPFKVSNSPQEQMLFQLSSEQLKHKKILCILEKAKEQGCEKVFVYCNSLSGAVDFPKLAKETKMKIITPLDVYEKLAKEYKNIGVIAANAVGLAGIEKIMVASNSNLNVFGFTMLPLVKGIEIGKDPNKLVEEHKLVELMKWFRIYQIEALILGCTHFPYCKEELEKHDIIPLIDPVDEMYSLLCK